MVKASFPAHHYWQLAETLARAAHTRARGNPHTMGNSPMKGIVEWQPFTSLLFPDHEVKDFSLHPDVFFNTDSKPAGPPQS